MKALSVSPRMMNCSRQHPDIAVTLNCVCVCVHVQTRKKLTVLVQEDCGQFHAVHHYWSISALFLKVYWYEIQITDIIKKSYSSTSISLTFIKVHHTRIRSFLLLSVGKESPHIQRGIKPLVQQRILQQFISTGSEAMPAVPLRSQSFSLSFVSTLSVHCSKTKGFFAQVSESLLKDPVRSGKSSIQRNWPFAKPRTLTSCQFLWFAVYSDNGR